MQNTLGAAALISIFNACFRTPEYNTRLQGNGEEPIYLPENPQRSENVIIFTRDYFSSALHEVSHWCIAGPARLKREDYGYWYAPDGRSQAQQALFEKVEIKPQALEWLFHKACGRRFRVSADNLTAGMGASEDFKNAIFQQVMEFCVHGTNTRASIFARALAGEFGGMDYADVTAYKRSELDG